MKKILSYFIRLFGFCFFVGLLISKLENNKGWVKEHTPFGFYEKHVKRPLDFGLALFALILFWPFLIIIAIAVKNYMGYPIVFEQKRAGLGGRIFKIKKFRTMSNVKDDKGNLLPDEQRLTKFGSWLRASGADEALELFSILKGDMSLIGPRPLLVEYLPWYTKEQFHRHDVRPGLTGYAQAHGRNAVNWDIKLDMDVNYSRNITFLEDARIVRDTVRILCDRDGVFSGSSSIMESFIDYCVGVGRKPRKENEIKNDDETTRTYF